jgi:hypothetical protein
MKKITLLIIAAFAFVALQAQITYTTIFSDDFETTTKDFVIGSTTFKTGGIPSDFNVLKQTIWTTYHATDNPFISSGTVWKNIFSNATAANKTYSVAAAAENRSGGTGNQCLKFNMTGLAFGSYASPAVVRLISNNNLINFNTAIGEGLTKYETTFWARVDGTDKTVLLNTISPNTYLTLTSNWQKFTISRYTTGLGSSALIIDFYPLSDNSDYSIYIDDFEVKQRKIAYTSAATAITKNSFTANWAAVEGANSYNVIVEKSDGAVPAVWSAITGSPFTAGNVQTLAITNLDAAEYRYRVTATDGTITTVESNNTNVIVGTSGLLNPTDVFRIRQSDNNIEITSRAGLKAEIYNQMGQLISSHTTSASTLIPVSQKGILMIRVDGYTQKLLVK